MTIDELTKFIPLLQNDKFGEWVIDKKNDGTPDHPIQWPYVKHTPVVFEFIYTVHKFVEDNQDSGLYNYLEILEENDIKNFLQVDINSLNKQCVLAIIVYCVRQDRFCDGLLLRSLNDGIILKCLERLVNIG